MTKSVKKLAIAVLLALALCFAGFGLFTVKATKADSNAIIEINKSAYVKVGDGLENSGLKFVAKINKSAYDELFNTYDKVEAGIIIVPESKVTEAGGCTFDKLSLTEGNDYAITASYRLSSDNNYYEFDNAIQTIKDYNYNRNFVAAAFIKITDEDAENIANFTYSGGAYYQYSNTHTANVYDIAYKAYEDRKTSQTQGYDVALGGVYGRFTADEYAILKNYLDGVAVINETDGELSVKNGTYYVSPYTLVGNDKGDYVIDGKGVSATCFTYKEERKAVSPFSLGSNYVGFAKSDKAVYNNDGSVKVSAGILGKSDSEIEKYGINENGYVGFAGNYGVGTYIETTFSYSVEKVEQTNTDFGHDNIPQIVLFADEVNGKECEGKGIVLSTGVDNSSGTYGSNDDYVGRYIAQGPNRMTLAEKTNYEAIKWCDYKTKDYPLLTQKGLKADSNNTLNAEAENTIKTYKYVVGTFYNKSGNLVIRVSLLLKNGDNWSELTTSDGKSYTDIFFETTWTASDVAEMGTNIILMAEHKGSVYMPTTTFTYSAPYTDTAIPNTYISIKSNGATVGTDGSLTMPNKAAASTTGLTDIAKWASAWNYYAYIGDYGVGYYLDFEFTGYQMPQLILFAENDENSPNAYASITTYGNGIGGGDGADVTTNYNRKGVVILNGLCTLGDYLYVSGPNRMTNNNGTKDLYGQSGGLIMVSKDDENGAYKELTRTEQKANSDKEYFLSIGTFIGTDGKVWLDMLLKDNTTDTEICHLQKSLGVTEEQVGTGDIIILPPLGEDGTCLTDGGTSMVLKSFSTPYKKVVSSANFQ